MGGEGVQVNVLDITERDDTGWFGNGEAALTVPKTSNSNIKTEIYVPVILSGQHRGILMDLRTI